MLMSTLQASLVCKPSLCFSESCSSSPARPVAFCKLPLCRVSFSAFRVVPPKPSLCNRRSLIRCTLQPEAVGAVPQAELPKVGNSALNSGESEGVSGLEEAESSEKSEGLVENGGAKSRLAVVVFAMGVWGVVRSWFEKLLGSDWFSWWPFWRQEKRLERLIMEADSNPMDVEKQTALLVELNKHRLGF